MNLTELNPQALWRHFAEICAIPHPSGQEAEIRNYIVNFALTHGLEYEVDEADNVIVRKPATEGMEDRRGIVLQAHLDMVPQKNGDTVFDFTKDGIEAWVDGDRVRAKGTTLGADNGIGVSAILAVLESNELKHGDIEALFTATEETGMDGANGLRADELKGERLLNLDSETEGELYVGCAGGVNVNMSVPYGTEPTPAGHKALRIDVKGLKGGHSGIEIILERANANKLLFRIIGMGLKQSELRLSSVDGGGLRNAIPREATATVTVPESKITEFTKVAMELAAVIEHEFEGIEDSIKISLTEVALPENVMNEESAQRLSRAVCGCPNGVMKMSHSMPGLVQTSTNLARVVSESGSVGLQALVRSSVDSEKENVADMISAVFELAGAEVELTGAYSGWNPNMSSPILKTMSEGYAELYSTKPLVAAIHAGLECGIIGGVYPRMDMISFGPTISFPHSPDESVDIASVKKFWDFLCHTLEYAPVK
jgi:dipeptidase D